MNILVTGGAGYIGSHMVTMLLERGENVVVVDNFATSSPIVFDNIKKICNRDVKYYECDIADKVNLDKVFKQNNIDAVIHFAAFSLVGESVTNPMKYYENNIYGTKCLLEVMLNNNVNKIVFSSTAAVYGDPDVVPILETNKTDPTNPYGETKLAIEKMMKWFDRAYGLKYVALRYFNACGAHPSGLIGENHNPETHLIPIILQVANGKRAEFAIYGDDYATPDGSCIRDYIHICDLAEAHILAIKYLLEGNDSNVFNLGNGVGFSVKQVLDTAEKVVGANIAHKIGARREGDPAVLTASSEKAQRVLGWKPKMNDLSTIISTAWNYHSNKQ